MLGNYRGNLEVSERKQLQTAGENERSEIYKQAFFKSVIKDPRRLIKKTYKRAKLFWTATPRMGGPMKPKKGSLSEQMSGIYYIFLLTSGLIGLCLTVTKNRGAQLLALSILSLPFPYYLTWFSRFRYRFPVEVILVILSSFTLWYLWSSVKKKWAKI